MYEVGTNAKHKKTADEVFLENMKTYIEWKTKMPFLGWLRKRAAKRYYLAVCVGGGAAFWDDKLGLA